MTSGVKSKLPDDVAQRIPSLTVSEAKRLWKADTRTLQQVAAQHGVSFRVYDPAAGARARYAERAKVAKRRITPSSEGGVYRSAAEHLARSLRCLSWRSDERGALDPKGKYWRIGAIVITPDELIERAQRKGWARL